MRLRSSMVSLFSQQRIARLMMRVNERNVTAGFRDISAGRVFVPVSTLQEVPPMGGCRLEMFPEL